MTFDKTTGWGKSVVENDTSSSRWATYPTWQRGCSPWRSPTPL
jgi:hypothetical protein